MRHVSTDQDSRLIELSLSLGQDYEKSNKRFRVGCLMALMEVKIHQLATMNLAQEVDIYLCGLKRQCEDILEFAFPP